MKKFITTLYLLLGLFMSLLAQTPQASKPSPGTLYRQCYKFARNELNVDSAFYYFKQVFADTNDINTTLKFILYNSFPETFTHPDLDNLKDTTKRNRAIKIKLLHKELLQKVANEKALQSVEPIQSLLFWSKVQDNQDNHTQLKLLTNAFLAQIKGQKDYNDGHTGRYALMIYHIINKHPDLQTLSKKLFTTIKENLRNNQVIITANSSSKDLQRRACHRYLYAYINSLEASSTSDLIKKQALLKTAFEYSPDLTDKGYKSGYNEDKKYLEGKENYGQEYLDFLEKTGKDKKEVLSILLKAAIYNPVYKENIKTFYEKMDSSQKPFNIFWRESIENNALFTTGFSLKMLDKTAFSSKEHKGKWILLDFWTTWCKPCREEHPTLQKFYDTTVLQNTDKVLILTIACDGDKDTDEKVLKYMKEKRLSFPVAIADTKIEKKFAVSAYPTKVLITPEGKYLSVPHGIDWITLIKEYAEL